jgi:hypothetical protein
MNKFSRFEELVGKVTHTHMKVSAKGRHIVVTFYNETSIVATYKVTDNVAWEVK